MSQYPTTERLIKFFFVRYYAGPRMYVEIATLLFIDINTLLLRNLFVVIFGQTVESA
ncbi:hypothetical protein GCM10027577_34220 [Spirosoma fluminis]